MSATNEDFGLEPATRKRAPRPASEGTATPATDLGDRLAALEHALLAIDRRLATNDARATATGPDRDAQLVAAVTRLESAVASLDARVGDLQAALAAQDVSLLQDEVRLVADRLGTLLGGPSLSELMDRIDEIDRLRASDGDHRSRRKRRLTTQPAATG